MKLLSVFRLFCFMSLVHRHRTVAHQHRHKDGGDNDSLLRGKNASPSPGRNISPSSHGPRTRAGVSAEGASPFDTPLCEWPCLTCIGKGAEQKCIECRQGFDVSSDNQCHKIVWTLSNDHTGEENEATDRRKALIAAIFVMVVGIGLTFFGFMAFFCAYCREECCHLSPHLSPGIDAVRAESVATSQRSIMSSSSQEMVSDSVVVIVLNPDDDFAVGVKK